MNDLEGLQPAARAALADLMAGDDDGILGLVLSGSAARGMATDHSDVDVYVVLSDEAAQGRVTQRSPAIDEIPTTIAELEQPGRLGTDDWWNRWSFAWARVLRDDTGGRITRAVEAHAHRDGAEQSDVLLDRLDGYVNFVYRALKSERDGRPVEQRLDAAESVAWWLDTVFALSGRVRPYNKYLAWELREHPLQESSWSAELLLPQVERILDGDASVLREAFTDVERVCLAWDRSRRITTLGDVLDSWGDELDLLR